MVFAGIRGEVLGEAVDGAHVVRLVAYSFPDGSVCPYVEASESHDGGDVPRRMALSTVVHLMQNVGETEAFQIGNRERGAESR